MSSATQNLNEEAVRNNRREDRIDDLIQMNKVLGIQNEQLRQVQTKNVKNHTDYVALKLSLTTQLKKNETLSAELARERIARGRVDWQKKKIKALTAEVEQLREQNAALVAAKKKKVERRADGNQSGTGGATLKEEGRVTEPAVAKKMKMNKCPRKNLRTEVAAMAEANTQVQHQVAEPVVTQGKETANPEVNVGPKEVAKEGVVAQESVVSNISDSNLRKKCFEDEEIVDEVDDDTEKLIMETYSKKVSFEDDVQEQVVVEEESEEEGAAEEVVATVDNPLPTNEVEEGAEGPIVGEIGQFRKKTFDGEEVIDEVDPEVEAVISGTYSTVSVEEEESSA